MSKSNSSVQSGSDINKVKRPDRKKLEEEMKKLAASISNKEDELKSILSACDQEQMQKKQKALRIKKDQIITERRIIDEQLQSLNKDISNKKDGAAKIRSNLNYTNEDTIDERIKRLEYQLQINNFKVKEEKRIVQEIDSLKRSKRNLKEYNLQKQEISDMGKKQIFMRSERDALYKKVTQFKAQEELLKKEYEEAHKQSKTVQSDINSLYADKRKLKEEFKVATAKYDQYVEEQRRLSAKKKIEERQAAIEAKQKDEDHIVTVQELYLEERQLCTLLLAHLQRFDCTSSIPSSTTSVDSGDSSLGAHSPMTPQRDGETEGFFRRKEDIEDLFPGLPNKTRKSRRDKKRHLQKLVTHSPEILQQFHRLNLQAPSTLAEVPVSLEQLKIKKKYFDQLANHHQDKSAPDLPFYNLSSCAPTYKVDKLQDNSIKDFNSNAPLCNDSIHASNATVNELSCNINCKASTSESLDKTNHNVNLHSEKPFIAINGEQIEDSTEDIINQGSNSFDLSNIAHTKSSNQTLISCYQNSVFAKKASLPVMKATSV